jgi:Uma2 family endonuclease
MIDAGILTEDDNLELLEGYLVIKMPKNRRHSFLTQTLRDLLPSLIPSGFHVNDQEPITTLDSEPEPDLSVVRGARIDYRNHHPYPEDIALVIEVSDSILRQDHITKQRIYAAGGIPIYWLINLTTQTLESYTQPSGACIDARFEQRTDYTRGDNIMPILDGKEIATFKLSDALPPSAGE